MRSVRGKAGQLLGSDGAMAELLLPDGYIVPVSPGFSAGYWPSDQA